MFKNVLKGIMAENLLSKEKLSEITGATVSLIDKWLSGEIEPDEKQINKLSDKLNLSVKSLTDENQTLVKGWTCNIIIAIETVLCTILSIICFFLDYSYPTLWIPLLSIAVLVFSLFYFHRYKLSDILLLPIIPLAVYICSVLIMH